MKNQKYHTVGTVPKTTSTIVIRGQIDTSNTQIYEHSPNLICYTLDSYFSLPVNDPVINITIMVL